MRAILTTLNSGAWGEWAYDSATTTGNIPILRASNECCRICPDPHRGRLARGREAAGVTGAWRLEKTSLGEIVVASPMMLVPNGAFAHSMYTAKRRARGLQGEGTNYTVSKGPFRA